MVPKTDTGVDVTRHTVMIENMDDNTNTIWVDFERELRMLDPEKERTPDSFPLVVIFCVECKVMVLYYDERLDTKTLATVFEDSFSFEHIVTICNKHECATKIGQINTTEKPARMRGIIEYIRENAPRKLHPNDFTCDHTYSWQFKKMVVSPNEIARKLERTHKSATVTLNSRLDVKVVSLENGNVISSTYRDE